MDAEYYEIGPGFGAFLAVFVLAVAVIIIYRSMSKHLRKVRIDAQAAASAPKQAGSAGVEDRDGGGDVVEEEAGNR